jgi:hypothetical protein
MMNPMKTSERKPDPVGLEAGVTPKSLGGAMLQLFFRLFRKKR